MTNFPYSKFYHPLNTFANGMQVMTGALVIIVVDLTKGMRKLYQALVPRTITRCSVVDH